MRKSIWCWLLTLLLVFALAAPAGAELAYDPTPGAMPIVPNPEDLPAFTIVAARNPQQYVDYDELPFWKMLQETTGIRVEWTEIPSTSVIEKVNLVLASNNLPDAFLGCISNDMISTYYDQGVLLKVNDLINEYIPNLAKIFKEHPYYASLAMAPDGGYYGFPYIEEMYGLVLTSGPFFINQTWLDQVGLPLPTTTEEFKNALIAFRDAGDLNGNGVADEIPYTLSFGNTNPYDSYDTFNTFCAAFGQANTAGNNRSDDYMSIKDGKAIFTAADPAYRETAKFFHELYAENLIDINAFAPAADKATAHYTSVLSASDAAVYGAFGIWNVNTYLQSEDVVSQYVPVPRLTGPNGKTGEALNLSEMQQAANFAITTACKNPEVLALLVNYLYTPELSVQANGSMAGYIMMYDDEGCLRENLDENGKVIYPEGSGWASVNDVRYNTRGSKMCSALFNDYYEKYVTYDFAAIPILEGQRGNGKDEILSDTANFPPILKTSEEQIIVSQLQGNIKNIVESYRMRWILEGNADESWDQYLSELNAAGLDQMVAAFQQAYDRYLEAM